MINYTYKDFEKALQDSGLSNSFSAADMELARQNPNAGITILNAKIDYNNATTDEGKYLANQRAEDTRKKYGSYSGGSDGSRYYYVEQTPSSFTPSISKPTYNENNEKINALYDEIKNYKNFSYNPETDPLYSAYKKQYTREGERAIEDTLGSAAMMSGGIPSSYAVTAGAQAGNYYSAALADKIPELEQLAYSRHVDDYNRKVNELALALEKENTDYARYLNRLNDYEKNKEFEYKKYIDDLNYYLDKVEKPSIIVEPKDIKPVNDVPDGVSPINDVPDGVSPTIQNRIGFINSPGYQLLKYSIVPRLTQPAEKARNEERLNSVIIPDNVSRRIGNAGTQDEMIVLINSMLKNKTISPEQAEALIYRYNIIL